LFAYDLLILVDFSDDDDVLQLQQVSKMNTAM